MGRPVSPEGRGTAVPIVLTPDLLEALDAGAEMWFGGNRSALVRRAVEDSLKRWATRPPKQEASR